MSDSAFSASHRPQFAKPWHQILLMFIVMLLTALGSFFIYPRVEAVFLANPYLNGMILIVFVVGVLACFLQVLQLVSSASWLEAFANNPGDADMTRAPSILAPLASLLRGRGSSTQIGASSSRSILESVATRLDEVRDITRYIINLLIFLGLLGTFYGLATTVPAVVKTIQSLAPSEGEGGIEVFGRLMSGLEEQLGGMGTAFASSLLGLAGSLVVGLLELFAGHGQNRFYRELEEWLSTITRVGFASGELGGSDTNVAAQVMDHMVAQLDGMTELFVQAEEARRGPDARMSTLAVSVEQLAERMDPRSAAGSSDEMRQILAGQNKLIAALEAQAKASVGGEHVDAESRMRLRSIDVQLLRILEEMAAGRQESVAELRGELASLSRALRQPSRGADLAGSASDARQAKMQDNPGAAGVKPRRTRRPQD